MAGVRARTSTPIRALFDGASCSVVVDPLTTGSRASYQHHRRMRDRATSKQDGI